MCTNGWKELNGEKKLFQIKVIYIYLTCIIYLINGDGWFHSFILQLYFSFIFIFSFYIHMNIHIKWINRILFLLGVSNKSLTFWKKIYISVIILIVRKIFKKQKKTHNSKQNLFPFCQFIRDLRDYNYFCQCFLLLLFF